MASSRVMTSSAPAPSIYTDPPKPTPTTTNVAAGSMNMEDLMRNIYDGDSIEEKHSNNNNNSSSTTNRSADDVWKEINGGSRKIEIGGSGGFNGEITLEEYLSKEEIRVPVNFAMETAAIGGFENGEGGGGRGRGRRRQVMDPVDRAAMQRQKRMIKNRESAARSRERKQAYTVELETLVTQLEEENAQLMREKEEQNRKRFRELMETLIPVTEGKRPRRRLLNRTNSL